MDFRIADTFTDSLARLTGDEQKVVKTTAFDLQINPASPGMNFHKLGKAKDRNFWSVRVNADIRLIVHKTAGSLLLCYVDHHDKAYDWAERRKLETHPKTGAAQLVEIRESIKEVIIPIYVHAEMPRPTAAPPFKGPVLAHVSKDDLLKHGVPEEWLNDVSSATEDTLLTIADHLPAEAAEAILELATGGKPRQVPTAKPANPFDHPDAQRRFRVMSNMEELQRALDYPWDKWTVFLHPAQRKWVEQDYSGPARIAGSAGTGKTIVALHRVAHLARQHPDSRILLTTFSDTLAHALKTKLTRLMGSEPRLGERIDVHALDAIAARLYKSHVNADAIVDPLAFMRLLADAAHKTTGHSFSTRFLLTEWNQVVDAWQISSWEGYRDVARLGRKTRLSEAQRKILWSIFEKVRQGLQSSALITQAELFNRVATKLAADKSVVFDFCVVDEAQDLGVSHLRFVAALGGQRPNALFFAGDLGQRIFQAPFSWKAVGVDVRGRSRTLRVNYRTSHQIRSQADRLLGSTVSDVDGITEERHDTISVFNGPVPRVETFADEKSERDGVSRWLMQRSAEGLAPHELAIFVRSSAQLARAVSAVEKAGLQFKTLDNHVETRSGFISICTMHLAKGLEFRAAVVMACDDEIIPLQERIESVGDDADLQEVYDTERHLLYVACTRARDYLLVTSVAPASEFLDDLRAA